MTYMWIHKSALGLIGFLLALATGSAALAHELDAARLTISEDADGAYSVLITAPVVANVSSGLQWPDGCAQMLVSSRTARNEQRVAFAVTCETPPAAGTVLRTDWGKDGVFVTFEPRNGPARSALISGDASGVDIDIGANFAAARPALEVAKLYLEVGFVHILIGWDHLAFLLCLCYLARGRDLILMVTAFTLGHSLSLGLAFFDVVRLPSAPVEAAIALSIAIMAREALSASSSAARPGVTTAFGLLHGLGFAGVLGDIGVSHSERVLGLLFFNIGVEIGQLVFVGGALIAIALLARLAAETLARAAILYSVGALSVFWTIERVVGFAS